MYLRFHLLIFLLFLKCIVSCQTGKSGFLPFYRIYGSGAPVLIINGGPGMNCEGFAGLAAQIGDLGYQTIIYDQRGTGRSVPGEINSSTINMEALVEDIEVLRNYLGFEKWTLLGHSFGGIIATCYAHKYPEHIDKLIFSSSGGLDLSFREGFSNRLHKNLTVSQTDSLRLFQEKIDAGDDSQETRLARSSVLANAYVFNKSLVPIIAKRLIQIDWNINNLVFEDLEKIRYNYNDMFKNFTRPVLILQGRNDIIAVNTAENIHSNFPGSRLVLMDHCGHYGWLDQKDVYLNSVRDFLKS